MAAGGKYTAFRNRKKDLDGEIYSSEALDSEKSAQVLRAQHVDDTDPRNAPFYPAHSIAQQQNRNGNMYGYGYSGQDYGGRRVTGFGIGGSPAEGETQGRGFGQTLGTGIGKVFGAIFAPVNYVMNGGVNVLRGVEDSTGMRGLGVGVSQNGYGYGRDRSHIAFSGSYDSHNQGRTYRQNMSASGGETGGLLSGMFGNRANTIEKRADGFKDTDFFKSDTSLFAMVGEGHIPSMNGAKNSIFNRPSNADKAFVEGYNNTLGEYRSLVEDSRRAQNPDDFALPPTAVTRQKLCAAIFDAAMDHADAHPEDYYHTNTSMAAKSYQRVVGDKWSPPLPNIEEKSTINNLKMAFGAASDSDAHTLEVANIVDKFRKSGNEAALNAELANFMSGRSELFNSLNSREQQLHASLSQMQFSDPTAQAVQNTLLADTKIWKEGYGVVTNSSDEAFGVFLDGGAPVLRMKLNGQNSDIVIPQDKMQSTFALIGAFSVKNETSGEVKKEALEKVLAEVKTYPDSEMKTNFISALEGQKGNIEQKERDAAEEKQAKVDTEQTEKARTEQVKAEAEKKIELANKELPKVEAQITTATTELASATKVKTEAEAKLETAKAELKTHKDAAKVEVASLKPSAWSLFPPVAVFNYATGANEKISGKLEVVKAEITAKEELVSKAETQVKAATDSYAKANDNLTELKSTQVRLLAESGQAKEALAAAEAQARQLAEQKAEEAAKTAKTEKSGDIQSKSNAFAQDVVNAAPTNLMTKEQVQELANNANKISTKVLETENPSEKAEIIKSEIAKMRAEVKGTFKAGIVENLIVEMQKSAIRNEILPEAQAREVIVQYNPQQPLNPLRDMPGINTQQMLS